MEKKFSIRAVIAAAVVPTILFGGVAGLLAYKTHDLAMANEALNSAMVHQDNIVDSMTKVMLNNGKCLEKLIIYYEHSQKDSGAPHRYRGECKICDKAYWATQLINKE